MFEYPNIADTLLSFRNILLLNYKSLLKFTLAL